MRKEVDFIQDIHLSTKRDYLARVLDEKVRCMEIARTFGEDYWDGERRYGFGGYRYLPGRWTSLALKLIEEFSLSSNSKILDLGCGKGFLLYELQLLLPGIQLTALDISDYALENFHPELIARKMRFDCRENLPFQDLEFDLVLSINTLHNFSIDSVVNSVREIGRVGKSSYIVVESYRNLEEFFNLQCWALTAPTIITPEEWNWLFDLARFDGVFEFIYFG
jgi:SAM-dependent methyltransferase